MATPNYVWIARTCSNVVDISVAQTITDGYAFISREECAKWCRRQDGEYIILAVALPQDVHIVPGDVHVYIYQNILTGDRTVARKSRKLTKNEHVQTFVVRSGNVHHEFLAQFAKTLCAMLDRDPSVKVRYPDRLKTDRQTTQFLVNYLARGGIVTKFTHVSNETFITCRRK